MLNPNALNFVPFKYPHTARIGRHTLNPYAENFSPSDPITISDSTYSTSFKLNPKAVEFIPLRYLNHLHHKDACTTISNCNFVHRHILNPRAAIFTPRSLSSLEGGSFRIDNDSNIETFILGEMLYSGGNAHGDNYSKKSVINETPILGEISSQGGNFDSGYNNGDSFSDSLLSEPPILHEILTSPTVGFGESDNCGESLNSTENDINLNSTFLSRKYTSKEFVDKKDIDHQEVSQVMRQMRVKNIYRVIIGHLNVNFMAPKIDAITTIIPGNVDIMVFSETKLDDSYPATQLLIEGFGKPFSLDRNAQGGGLLIYVRSDIPCKQLSKHDFPDGIEGIFVEIRFRKSKWLPFGTYHPPSQDDKLYFNSIGQGLDVYMKSYDKFLLIGDFNAEEGEADMENFMELYDLGNLIKEKTCFKSVENPSCLDLFLTNCVRSFQNTKVISTGVS